jgi:hypothetical protein
VETWQCGQFLKTLWSTISKRHAERKELEEVVFNNAGGGRAETAPFKLGFMKN